MDLKSGGEVLASKKTFMVVGDQDPFVTPTRISEFDQFASQLGIQPKKVIFSGTHEINEGVLDQFS